MLDNQQCSLNAGAWAHIFVLGRHLGFCNCGGLERGKICAGPYHQIQDGGIENLVYRAFCYKIMLRGKENHKTKWFLSSLFSLPLFMVMRVSYLPARWIFKTHKASLPWTSAPQARSEHYSQACHLSLPQTQWTRYSCGDWEVFDVTPPHHGTMRPIGYSESSTEKQDTSVRITIGIMYLRYIKRTASLQTFVAWSSRTRAKWKCIQKHKR